MIDSFTCKLNLHIYKTSTDKLCVVYFSDESFKIKNSYRFNVSEMREIVSQVIVEVEHYAENYTLSVKDIFGKWLVHNICYKLRIKRSSTQDCDIHYMGEKKKCIRLVYKLFGKLY